MTNPAEKIRQVVEDATNAIDENESLFPDKKSARSHVVHIVAPVLDAVIAEMEVHAVDLPPSNYEEDNYNAGRNDEAYETIEWLKQARSELLQQQ